MKATITALFCLLAALLLTGCQTDSPALQAAPGIQPSSMPPGSLPGVEPTVAQDQTAPAEATPEPAEGHPAAIQTEPAPVVPTPTPLPELRPLTGGGCCVQPFWSPDSQRVLFIDKPAPDGPAGVWGVDRLGSPAQLVSDRLGIFSSDQQLRAFPEGGQTIVERLSDGQRWTIPSGGRAVSFSLDGQKVAWTTGQGTAGSNSVPRQIWVSQVDGSQARQVLTLPGGSFAGWFPDGRLLISGRLEAPETGQALWALTLPVDEAGQPVLTELGRGERIRGTSISPDGRWLAYLVTLSTDPEQNGIWLVDTQSGEKRRLEFFGGYRWRDGSRLLVVPLDLEQAAHRLWQVDLDSGEAIPLTDPAITSFKIANGDWSVSPDGRQVAFVSADDQNIWLLTLPEN
jgi:Tol biopolymer transport system component